MFLLFVSEYWLEREDTRAKCKTLALLNRLPVFSFFFLLRQLLVYHMPGASLFLSFFFLEPFQEGFFSEELGLEEGFRGAL